MVDTKSKQSEVKRGRKPVPAEKKRVQIAARVKPHNFVWAILFKKTLEPEKDNSFNDANGEASLGRVIDNLVEMAIAAGITAEVLVLELEKSGIAVRDIIKAGQIKEVHAREMGLIH